jgi:dephospho-CoA kinase
MLMVGLTGGIGSGKTLVCSIFEKLKVPVYHADEAARRLMNSDAGLMESIREMFGDQAYGRDGLNRAYLAGLVFGDEERLSGLNKLVHPAVRDDFKRWAGQQRDAAYVIEEAAILFESGASQEMDLTILVHAPEEVRIRRVMERDGVSRVEVLKRIRHQMREETLMKMADHHLLNDGTTMILPQVVELHNKILNRKE